VGSHGHGQLNQRIHGVDPRGWRLEPKQLRHERRAVGDVSSMLDDPLDLIAFEHCDIHKLARFFVAVMLNHQQVGAETSSTKHKLGIASKSVPPKSPLCRIAVKHYSSRGLLDG
jgi:hypothetical protein